MSRTSYFGRIFRVPEVCVSDRLLQTVLFLTDSVFRVLLAYFDASMASMQGYEPQKELHRIDLQKDQGELCIEIQRERRSHQNKQTTHEKQNLSKTEQSVAICN